MGSQSFSAFLALLLGSFAVGFSGLHYESLWIWTLPLIACLSFFHFDFGESFEHSREFWIAGALLSAFAFLFFHPLQNMTAPSWRHWYRLCLILSGLGSLGLILYADRHQRLLFASVLVFQGIALWLITKMSPYPLLDVFAQSGFNGRGWPPLLEWLQFSSKDVRIWLILFHLGGAVLLVSLSGKERRSWLAALLYLSSPALLTVIEPFWNEAPAILLLFGAVWCLQQERKNLFFIAVNLLLVLMPAFIFVAPFLIFWAAKSRQKSLFSWLNAALLPALLLGGFLWLSHGGPPMLGPAGPQNPFGYFEFLFWLQQHTGLQGSSGAFFFLYIPVAILTAWRWRRERELSAQRVLMDLALLSLASLQHLWFSLSFFFVVLAWPASPRLPARQTSLSRWAFLFLASRFFLIFSWPLRYTDTIYYLRVANKMFQGRRPYIDFAFEYPPLALPPILLPRALIQLFGTTTDFWVYRSFHSWIYFLIDAGIFFFFEKLRRQGRISVSGLVIYILGGFLLGELLYDRLDLLMILFVVLALTAWTSKKDSRAGIHLILGAFLKLVPLIAFPLLLLNLKTNWLRVRDQLHRLVPALGAALLLTSACYLLFGWRFLDFLKPHENRGIQIESLWSSLYYVLHACLPERFADLRIISIYGAFHLFEPPTWLLTLGRQFGPLSLVVFYLGLLWLSRGGRRALPWGRACFALFCVFILFCKVFSPQYMIWLVALFPLAGYHWDQPRDRVLFFSLLISLISTALLFHDYMELVRLRPWIWNLLVLRNLALVFLSFFVLRDLIRESIRKAPPESVP